MLSRAQRVFLSQIKCRRRPGEDRGRTSSTDRGLMTTHTVRLDVRPILASGRDPFEEIMQAAGDVPVDGFLVVVAPFDPVPLREKLGASGFTSTAVSSGPQEWEITFYRAAAKIAPERPRLSRARAAPPGGDERNLFAQPGVWTDHGEVHLDARGLVPAAAINAILAALDAIGSGRTLVAHLDDNIDALYPELVQRDCEAAFVPGERDEVRLEISTPPVGNAGEKRCAGASESLDPHQRTRGPFGLN
jgi:uncharacterized protein (DUF2249 family)